MKYIERAVTPDQSEWARKNSNEFPTHDYRMLAASHRYTEAISGGFIGEVVVKDYFESVGLYLNSVTQRSHDFVFRINKKEIPIEVKTNISNYSPKDDYQVYMDHENAGVSHWRGVFLFCQASPERELCWIIGWLPSVEWLLKCIVVEKGDSPGKGKKVYCDTQVLSYCDLRPIHELVSLMGIQRTLFKDND